MRRFRILGTNRRAGTLSLSSLFRAWGLGDQRTGESGEVHPSIDPPSPQRELPDESFFNSKFPLPPLFWAPALHH